MDRLKGKLHSKIISDLVGFFHRVWWWKSEVKLQTGTPSNRRLKMAKKSQVMKTRLALHHWCQVSKIRGCGMVFNLTERIRFTTTGRLWSVWQSVIGDRCNTTCAGVQLPSISFSLARLTLTFRTFFSWGIKGAISPFSRSVFFLFPVFSSFFVLFSVKDIWTLFPKAEKIPAIIFRAYILTSAAPRSIWRGI